MGSGFILDGSEAEVEKAKGVQNRHEDSAENIENSVEHSCFPPFLSITLVNANITQAAGSDNTVGLLVRIPTVLCYNKSNKIIPTKGVYQYG